MKRDATWLSVVRKGSWWWYHCSIRFARPWSWSFSADVGKGMDDVTEEAGFTSIVPFLQLGCGGLHIPQVQAAEGSRRGFRLGGVTLGEIAVNSDPLLCLALFGPAAEVGGFFFS